MTRLLLSLLLLPLTALAQNSDVIEKSLENWPVGDYLLNTSYVGIITRDRDYYSYSKMPQYSGKDYRGPLSYYKYDDGKRHDWPETVKIAFPEDAALPLMVVYGDSLRPSAKDTIIIAEPTDSIEIANLIPQRTYLYEMGDTSGNVIADGRIHTLGNLRMIKLDKGNNVRDIGGWQTYDGQRLKYGRIYRGSEITKGWRTTMTEEDKAELLRLGVAAEIDLRDTNNISGGRMTQSSFGEAIPFVWLPMKDAATLLKDYPHHYKTAFEFMLEQFRNRRPVYIHCTYGADRAGMLSMLVEALCGVTLDNIYKDYELSSMAELITARYFFIVNGRLIRELGIYSTDEVQPTVRAYLHDQAGLTDEQLDEFIYYMLSDEGWEPSNNDTPEGITTHYADRKPYRNAAFSLDGRSVKGATVSGVYVVVDETGGVRKVIR